MPDLTPSGNLSGQLLLQIPVYGVLDPLVISIEMAELISNRIKPFPIQWRVLSQGRQVLFVAVNHLAQSISSRTIASELLVVRNPRLGGFHVQYPGLGRFCRLKEIIGIRPEKWEDVLWLGQVGVSAMPPHPPAGVLLAFYHEWAQQPCLAVS